MNRFYFFLAMAIAMAIPKPVFAHGANIEYLVNKVKERFKRYGVYPLHHSSRDFLVGMAFFRQNLSLFRKTSHRSAILSLKY